MTDRCPHPPETLTGVLTLALDDAEHLVWRPEQSLDAPFFEGGPFASATGRTRWRDLWLGTAIARETLARVPLDAHPRTRRAPVWGAALTAASALQEGLWMKAWRAVHGAGTGPGAWRKTAGEFEQRVSGTVDQRIFDEALYLCKTVGEFSDWVAWAKRKLKPAIERTERAVFEEGVGRRPAPDSPSAPATLADTLALAIADGRSLLKASADQAAPYQFQSDLWHHSVGDDGEACAVCAAGAVMVRQLDAGGEHDVRPESFGPAWCAALNAIEDLRIGDWVRAFNRMHGTPEHPGAVYFAEHTPERNETTSWGDPKGYARWLDMAEQVLFPAVRKAEDRALEVR